MVNDRKPRILPARSEDLKKIAGLIASRNKTPETQCIHCDTGEDIPEILQEMDRLYRDEEIRMVAAHEGEQCIGFLGSEVDVEGERGWLRGPIITADGEDWSRVALELWEAFLPLLPSRIRRLDAFPNASNRRARTLYLEQGFQEIRLIHAYTAYPPRETPDIQAPGTTLQARHETEFTAMHNAAFPDTLDGKRILSARDENHRVFAFTHEDEFLGYLYATIETGDTEGTVEFVAVREDARGRGIGLALLQTALRWFFVDKAMTRVGLVVNEELANAQALYERAGFHLKYTGVNLRREWETS